MLCFTCRNRDILLHRKPSRKDYKNFIDEIDYIFSGETEVADYTQYKLRGKLIDMKSDESSFRRVFGSNELFKYDLVDFYECESGGWNFFHLERISKDVYKETTYRSTDMGFKIPKSEYIPAKVNQYGIVRDSYYKSNNRGTVSSAYEKAKQYIIDNNINNFEKGSLTRISSILDIESKFHRCYTESDNKGQVRREIYDDKIVVGYKQNSIYYKTMLVDDIYEENLTKNLGIGLGISSIFYFLILLIFKLLKK